MKTIHSGTEAEAREKWHIAIESMPIGFSILACSLPSEKKLKLTTIAGETIFTWGEK